MIRSLLRRVAGAAALATVAGLVAAPALQAQAAVKAPTSLSIRAVQRVIEPGETAKVTGHLAVAGDLTGEGRVVTLEAKPLGTDEFVPVADLTAGERGGLRTEVMPEVTTRYRWRYDGAEDARASVSGTAAVRVKAGAHPPRRVPTSLSIRTVYRPTKDGAVDIVRGLLRARRIALRHRPVLLLSRTADVDAWTLEGVHRTRRHGVVTFRVDPEANTAYRLVFLGTRLLMPSRSGVVRVPVRPDVRIAADPASVTQGESATVSGTVGLSGAALPDAMVKLVAIPAGDPGAAQVVDHATTASDGSVSFTVTPEQTTRYRLKVVPGDTTAGAWSGVARVRVLVPAPSA